ncbi:hypothetical protein [Streptomyces spiramyceticus]|uniref:hypothetical protein n=1 Tax=Streptomyces spiramyceticus TaxID=299717 RepID=UPI00237B8A7A|nr:hypothetical protein [Streptomyces spiramyceticus]
MKAVIQCVGWRRYAQQPGYGFDTFSSWQLTAASATASAPGSGCAAQGGGIRATSAEEPCRGGLSPDVPAPVQSVVPTLLTAKPSG